MKQDANEDSERSLAVLRFRQAIPKVGLSRSAIYDRLNPESPRFDPTFPKPFSIGGGRAVGFFLHELDAWLLRQAQENRSAA